MLDAKPTGARRLMRASRNSWQGLRDTWRSEAAFRQEALCALPLLALIAMLELSGTARALLLVTLGLVFVVELLNTAIEAVVDRVGHDWHPLSGKAKDAASAAVTVSLCIHAGVWVCVL